MTSNAVQDRRKSGFNRHPTNGRFRSSQSPLHRSNEKSQAFEGKVKNISDGGFCVVATRPPERSGVLPAWLSFPRMPAQIPALVQVRRVERAQSSRHYRIGIQYAT